MQDTVLICADRHDVDIAQKELYKQCPPRKVKDKTASVSLLARVHTKFEVWPPDFEDYSFSLQTASNVVAPPTMTGELIKLDKGPAIDHLMKKHHLRPFLLDVYSVEFHFEH